MANVLTMSIAFLCLFSPFQTTQTLAGPLLGNLGLFSYGTLYCFFVFGGFVAPAIARGIGPMKGLVFGGATYVLFMASFTCMISPVVLACSALVGLGASVLWCSQGLVITRCTNESNKGAYSSLFWGIFNLAFVLGGLIGHFMLLEQRVPGYINGNSSDCSDGSGSGGCFAPEPEPEPPVEKWYVFKLFIGWTKHSGLFVVFGCIGALGTALFLLLRAPDPSTGSKPEPPDKRPVCTQVEATVKLMFGCATMLIVPHIRPA
jgi:hypothetical protein